MVVAWNTTAGLSSGASATFADDNLTIHNGGSSNSTVHVRATSNVVAQKIYFESKFTLIPGTRYAAIGIIDAGASGLPTVNGNLASGTWMLCDDGQCTANGGSLFGVLSPFTANDIAMIAIDLAAGKMWVGRNGTWQGDPVAGTGAAMTGVPPNIYPKATGFTYQGSFGKQTVNFGATAFAHGPPSGYVAYSDATPGEPAVTIYADPLTVPTAVYNSVRFFNAAYPIEKSSGVLTAVQYVSNVPPYQHMAQSRDLMDCQVGDYIEAELLQEGTWDFGPAVCEWAGMLMLRRATDTGAITLHNAGPSIDFRCMSENPGENIEAARHHATLKWQGATTVLVAGNYRVDFMSYASMGNTAHSGQYMQLHDGVLRVRRYRAIA